METILRLENLKKIQNKKNGHSFGEECTLKEQTGAISFESHLASMHFNSKYERNAW